MVSSLSTLILGRHLLIGGQQHYHLSAVMANGLCKYCGLPSNIGSRYYLSSSIDQTVANYCRMSLPSGTKNRLQKFEAVLAWRKKKWKKEEEEQEQNYYWLLLSNFGCMKNYGAVKMLLRDYSTRGSLCYTIQHSIAPAPARHYYTLVMNLACSSPDLGI